MNIYQKCEDFYQRARTEKRVIGETLFHRKIYAVKVGEGRPTGIAQYAVHGREYPTAELAFAHYERGVAKGSCWLLPLLNPDGALLSEIGVSSAPKSAQNDLVCWNGGEDFSLWKANGRGVDINVNFPARWGSGRKNIRFPASENYIGEAPFSERESRALKAFTEWVAPDYTLSFHAKGEEIYWYFYQPLRLCARDKRLAEVLSRSTGYPLGKAIGSAGGYKDWCIQRFSIPAFTVEVGKDCYCHPLKGEAVEDFLRKNKSALYDLSKEI